MSKNTRNRILLTAIAAVLLVTLAIGGTMAYLQAETTQVTNEFTPADINVELEETLQSDGSELGDEEWSAQLIPGVEYDKNPVVSVTGNANNVASYLFVQVTGAATAEKYLDIEFFYEVEDTEWKTLEDGVYYLELTAAQAVAGDSWKLIPSDTVTVKSSLTQNDTKDANFELSFQAYIIQQANFTPETAWAQVSQ